MKPLPSSFYGGMNEAKMVSFTTTKDCMQEGKQKAKSIALEIIPKSKPVIPNSDGSGCRQDSDIVIKSPELRRNLLDAIHTQMCENLLVAVRDPENLTPAMIAAVSKFLADNGAKLGVVTSKSPMGNLLDNLPFEVE